jgi:hypothetical protein
MFKLQGVGGNASEVRKPHYPVATTPTLTLTVRPVYKDDMSRRKAGRYQRKAVQDTHQSTPAVSTWWAG